MSSVDHSDTLDSHWAQPFLTTESQRSNQNFFPLLLLFTNYHSPFTFFTFWTLLLRVVGVSLNRIFFQFFLTAPTLWSVVELNFYQFFKQPRDFRVLLSITNSIFNICVHLWIYNPFTRSGFLSRRRGTRQAGHTFLAFLVLLLSTIHHSPFTIHQLSLHI